MRVAEAGMPEEANQNIKHRTAGSTRLKQAIDSGHTRDKVPAFDPGAAPLGTDEEAAGTTLTQSVTPPAAGSRAAAEFAADPAGSNRSSYRAQDRVIWPAIIIVTLIAAGAALAALLY